MLQGSKSPTAPGAPAGHPADPSQPGQASFVPSATDLQALRAGAPLPCWAAHPELLSSPADLLASDMHYLYLAAHRRAACHCLCLNSTLLLGRTWCGLVCKAFGSVTVLAGQKTRCWHSAHRSAALHRPWLSCTACLCLRAGVCCTAGLRRTRKRSLPCTSSPGMPASADDPQLDRAIAAALQQQEEAGETGSSPQLHFLPAEVMRQACGLPPQMQEPPGGLCKACGSEAPPSCLSVQAAMGSELQGLRMAAFVCTQW